MPKFANIVFMQDGSADEVLRDLCRVDGWVVARGATDETIAAAIEYLKNWDYGDNDEIRDEIGAGTRDEVVERDGYVLTWNLGLGYVGLMRRIEG